MQAADVALRFVGKINSHDVEGLVALMTRDHLFVDSLGMRSTRPAIEDGWRSYFDMVPDYWIKVERSFSFGGVAILVGAAGGTYLPQGGRRKEENRWESPAVWIARTRGGKISEWRIYADNEPIREKARKTREPTGARARSSRRAA
jgi:ketosteroid isomerase-like protein